MSELANLLDIARRAAALAGEVIMPLYASGTAVELKADRTPVTAADRNAELAVREFLARECPGHGILGEEFGESPGDGRHRWVLDPIDGTKSFVHHVPLFGTLIALERDGVPVVGVIACHAAGETASAARGLGAFLNGEPIHVSAVDRLEDATVSMTSYARTAAMHPKGFASLVSQCGLARAWGDCYGYLMVAAGRAEVMLDPEMSIWDAAALYPVITEAGGGFSQWDGTPGVGGSVVATNGVLHGAVLAALREDAGQ
ncbi:MAG: inositol monophosphatase family protein [Chloroflexi bacterium]|nr:inositol monophosphatase family protein [Chloroflexota bacterium]PWB45426.1 MAG: histidinol phosphate phosphatase [Dehalococcoidia bacterium]